MTNNSDINTSQPGWLEITIDIDPSAKEAVSDFLMGLGCDGVVSEDFESGLMKAYLPSESTDPDVVKNSLLTFFDNLKDAFPDIPAPVFDIKEIANQDWGTSWRSFFYLEKITDNLMILPAWEAMPAPVNCHVIRIDPGTAFGTGKHETTRMCLKAIEDNAPAKPWTMLDVGTGSGILSVYGAMLGAQEITAIDNDPEAVSWAEKNIALNELPVKIDLSTTPLDRIEKRYDIIVANIIMNTILELTPLFPALLATDGIIILSGILTGQIDRIVEDLKRYGLKKRGETIMCEWACLIVKKV
jgi:ribosomal protein L11 methyltransferase